MANSTGYTTRLQAATRTTIIGLVFVFFMLLIIFPVGSMFVYSSQEGLAAFWAHITNPAALFAIKFSLILAISTTAVNLVVGTMAAYALVKYDFFGKRALNAFVDIPVAIPTAVTGFTLLLLYGPLGILGKYLAGHGITMMFAFPGILLAHVFVTFPFVVRSVSSILVGVEKSYEEAATTLGASGFKVFRYITLPSIKAGLVGGGVLTFARSLGEFGATIMVSGNLMMKTQTAPLYIFSRFNMGDIGGASAVAIVLAVVSFVLLYSLEYITKGKEAER
jgi:sulfate transport system permease protein